MFFFFNDTATPEIYTLSLHDALPISDGVLAGDSLSGALEIARKRQDAQRAREAKVARHPAASGRSEEHTSELQSPDHLVCRLLLEKKKTITCIIHGNN